MEKVIPARVLRKGTLSQDRCAGQRTAIGGGIRATRRLIANVTKYPDPWPFMLRAKAEEAGTPAMVADPARPDESASPVGTQTLRRERGGGSWIVAAGPPGRLEEQPARRGLGCH